MAKQVLIVENSQDWRQLLQEIVEGLGYQTQVVNGVTQALTAIREHIISLILLDIRMPPIYGDDFLRFIRKHGNRIPVIVVSGYLTPEVVEVLRDHNVHQVIAKPFKVLRLVQAVTQVLAGDGR